MFFEEGDNMENEAVKEYLKSEMRYDTEKGGDFNVFAVGCKQR